MCSLKADAHLVASVAHAAVGQRRKYTGAPYIEHPIKVAQMVTRIGGTDEMVAAALLHDVVEDTEITSEMIRDWFGSKVALLVDELTEVTTEGNRATRKAAECARLAQISPEAQTIKLADLIDNTSTIAQYDPDFARVYFREKAELLKVLTNGAPDLLAHAQKLVDKYFRAEGTA